MPLHEFLIPRLNGAELPGSMPELRRLVRAGVGGFIIFGGNAGTLKQCIAELQAEAKLPLVISSDLEQGLGQQAEGGTLMPPAMAVARAEQKRPGIAARVYGCVAKEAASVGINTIYSPVLDVNTNPRNPIIGTRAFGSEPDVVSALGIEMIRAFKAHGVRSCGKHFPGHGDTSVDSHISLPRSDKTLEQLQGCELIPFVQAIEAGVDSMMLAHMAVPALDASLAPVSLSKSAVNYLRGQMGFAGVLFTDAMNMGGLGAYGPTEAARMAIKAGVDFLLHPLDPDGLARDLSAMPNKSMAQAYRKTLTLSQRQGSLITNESLVQECSALAIDIVGKLPSLRDPIIITFSDDEGKSAQVFFEHLKMELPNIEHEIYTSAPVTLPLDRQCIMAVFSSFRAWKGGSAAWIGDALKCLDRPGNVAVSFGAPYVLDGLSEVAAKVVAYWDAPVAQEETAKRLLLGL